MLKKAVFSVESLNIEPGAVSLDGALDAAKVVTINPPANMTATRCTIQLLGASTSAGKNGVLCISSQMPINGLSGLILINSTDTANASILPSQWTFENYNDNSWSQSIYLAAIGLISNDTAYVVVMWEGVQL